MDEQLRKLVEGAQAQGATKEDIKRIIDLYVADSKKKRVSEPTSVQKPLASSTQTPRQNTFLDTEEPAQAQASDGLGGPPKMKEFTGFTQEEQQKMKSPQKPATTLPTQQQIQATAGKPVKETITQYADIAKQKQNIEVKRKQDLLNDYISRHKVEYEESYNKFLNAHNDTDEDKLAADQEVSDEFNKRGFLNGLKAGAGNAWNAIVDRATNALTQHEYTKAPEALRVETDPTKEYFDKANKEYEQSVILSEEARKLDPSIQIPKYDAEKIKKRAYELGVQSKLDSRRESRINQLLREQTPDVQDMLKEHAKKDYQTLSQEDKKLLEISNASKLLYQKNTEKLIQLSNNIIDLESKGMQIPNELIAQLEDQKKTNNILKVNALKDQDRYSSKHEKLGSFEENLDVLNRDHSFSNNAYTTIKLIGNEMKRGGYGVLGYFSQLFPEGKEFEATNKWIDTNAKEESKKIEGLRSSIEKPLGVSGINSASDFGRWMSNSVIIPTAGFMAKLSNPEVGIPLLMGESLGNSYQDMKDQMEADPNIQYSKSQLFAAPALKSAIDGAMFLFDANLLKGAQRVIKSANNAEKELIADAVLKEITKKQLHGAAVMNGVTIAKNAVDKFSGIDPNKNLLDGTKDATAVSFVTVGMLDTAPKLAVNIASEFSLDNSAIKASNKVSNLELRLNQPDLSKEHKDIIAKQLEKAKEDMHKIVKSQVRDISSLSDKQYKEVVDLNNKRASIYEQAKSIKMDQSIKPEVKKQLFEGLKEQLDETNSRRRELLLNGPKAELERMDPVVADALRAKAESLLIKENNPNGEKDVTIPQDDIDRLAVVLHNEKAFEAKQAEEVSNIDANKADIEKRRKEDIYNYYNEEGELIVNPISSSLEKQIRDPKKMLSPSEQKKALKMTKLMLKSGIPHEKVVEKLNEKFPGADIEYKETEIDRINAKYDAELKALEQKPIEEKSVPLHETLTALEGLGKREKLRAIDSNIDGIIKELGLKTENC